MPKKVIVNLVPIIINLIYQNQTKVFQQQDCRNNRHLGTNGVRHTQLNLHHKLYFMFQWRSATTQLFVILLVILATNLNNGIPLQWRQGIVQIGRFSNFIKFSKLLSKLSSWVKEVMLRSNRSISQSVTFEAGI
jgi:hypothetical protein